MADDGFDFSPLTSEEREAGQETAPGGKPDAAKPTLPPADAEPAKAGAARLFGRKPVAAYELVESYFPSLPKIELHARGRSRPGWDAWGLEAEAVQ